MSRKVQLEQAYRATVEEIAAFCEKRSIPRPRLVAVSKYKPASDIEILYQLGHRHFGENYVQELQEKAKVLPKDIKWHFIGNLQSNKAKIAREIPNLAYVETLDGMSKATKLNTQRSQIEADPLGVFIQVNTSDEPQKAGIPASKTAELSELVKHVTTGCAHLKLIGLMTIGSVEQSKAEQSAENADFAKLVELRESLSAEFGIPLELSMGMSSDFLQAIQQGSSNVRVGSSIFGGRVTKEEHKEGQGAEPKEAA